MLGLHRSYENTHACIIIMCIIIISSLACHASGQTYDIAHARRNVAGCVRTIIFNLLQQCKCSDSDDMCFQWTLTINQMNYSKTDTNLCQPYGSTCDLKPAEMFPGIRLNATLGEVHVVNTHVKERSCLQQTVQCALNEINPNITKETL